jgi:hypothetical protein
LFSKAVLAERKMAIGLTAKQATEYVDEKYELTADDMRTQGVEGRGTVRSY